MWNPFKRKSKSLKALQSLSATFAILNEFERRGLLHWQQKEKCLLIEYSLAIVKLAEGERGFKYFLSLVAELLHLPFFRQEKGAHFKRFLTQCAQWQNFKLLQEAYERHRIDTEAKAVREAKKKYAVLTKADIQRIRQNARDNMDSLDPTAILGGATQDFDLFIIRATAPSSAHATEANGQLLALGHYDGKTLEMAMYEDIKHNLRKDE